ncbi:MAG: hypothetical protein J6C75_05305, partial [Oscillospiraceae bacterium]|nr:hypothetical protein [Oscillospiraceae bacterium]
LTKPNVVILCDALACDESNGMYAEEAIFKRGEKEYILEEVDFGEKEQIFAKRVGCVVDGYETILHDAVFRSFGDVDFQSAEVMTVLHYGLNQNEKNKYIEDAQAFFTFNLGAGALANGRFVNGTQSLDLASQQKQINTGANARKSTQIEKDIFTDDGFVQLEDAKFDFEKSGEESSKVKGEGRFRLLEIPYVIAVSDKKELRGETQQKRDAEGNMAFTVDDKGDINAQFDTPVVLNILEARNEADNVTSAIMLKGAAIKDSMLTAKDIQVERGFGIDKESGDENDSDIEKAAKMFGFGFHVAVANVGEVKSLDRLGIYAVAKKKKLGAFGVSDFLGFLDVSGNYAAGQLHAALKKDKKYGDKKDDQKDEEKKNGFSTIFGDEKEVKGEGDSGNGLGIPLGGPLSFVFSIKPVIGIGGMLSADLQRGEGRGFDEEMAPDETMDLKGSLNVDGFAALNASAGVAAGLNVITNIASVDIKLNASIGGGIGAELAGGTKLKKEEGKLAQANDLVINGNLKTYVKGTLSLSSDVRVFIWKAQIFKINLAEKRVDFSPLSVQISRKMGAKGLTDGWNFESVGLSADVFGKKAFGAIRDASKQPDPEPMKITQEEIETAGEDIKSAWAVLQDLRNEKKMTEQRVYFITPVEKAALDERIQTMTAQVKADLEKYVEKLKLYKNQLQEDEAAAAEEVKKARGEQEDYEQRKRIKDKALNDVEKAGFDAENYRPLTADNAPEMSEREREKENTRRKEMSSIDFAIARIIGIYDNAIADTMRDYDAFAQNKNKQMLEKDKNTPKNKLYKLSNEMQDHEFVFHDFDSWGKNHDLLKYATSFGSNGSNYYDALSVYAINRDEREKYGIYRKAFRRKNRFGEPEISDMTGRELLEIILRDKYPKGACDAKGNDRAGQPIGATPQQKMEALEYLFKKQLSVDVNAEDAQYLLKTTKKGLKLDQMRHDTDEVYQALFNSAMEKMTRKGNVDIDTRLAELEQKFAKAKEKHLQAIQNHLDAQTAVVKVEAELASSKAKLDELEGNVAKATALESGAPESATAALDFVEGGYKDIASGKTMVDALEGHEKAKDAMLGNSPSGTTAESISGNEPQ